MERKVPTQIMGEMPPEPEDIGRELAWRSVVVLYSLRFNVTAGVEKDRLTVKSTLGLRIEDMTGGGEDTPRPGRPAHFFGHVQPGTISSQHSSSPSTTVQQSKITA
jgi:hypothetical protein